MASNPIAALGGNWRAVLMCVFCTIGAFQFGYDSSYYSGILAMQPFLKDYGSYDPATKMYAMSASRISLTSSIINAGELVGAISAWFIGEKVGRKGGLYVSSTCVIVGIVIQVGVAHVAALIVGRLILGFSVGLISCFVPLYVADCAPAKLRGALVSMYQYCIGLGLLLGIIVDNCTHLRTDSGAYRIPMAVQLIFPIVLVCGLVTFAPESPRWLVEKGKIEQARKALARLTGAKPDVIDREIRGLQSTVDHDEATRGGSWASLFKGGAESRKAYLTFALQALQQATGINFVTSYGIIFFLSIGIDNAFIIQLGLYLVAMPAVWFSQYGIERFGRRPILIISGLLTAAILIIMGACGISGNTSKPIEKLIVAMVYLFLVVFNLGWGPTVWVLTSELSTGVNRGRIMSFSSGSNWFFNWLVTFTFPYLYSPGEGNLGPKIGFLYGCLTLAAASWVWFLVPETSGRSLEEIETMFREDVPARKFKSYEVQLPIDDSEVMKVRPKTDYIEMTSA